MLTPQQDQPSKRTSAAVLAIFFIATFSAAAIGGLFMPGEWYAELTKPSWNPPNWLFGPVWTTLYIMIALAGWCFWRSIYPISQQPRFAKLGLGLFALQLVTNGLWTWLFFGLQQPLWALVDILILDGLVIATILVFKSTSRLAAALLLPYLVWIVFATALNVALWQLN